MIETINRKMNAEDEMAGQKFQKKENSNIIVPYSSKIIRAGALLHLKKKYPYLFSLSMRTNPFDTNASAIIRE